MKRCPECRRDYYDDTLLYCLDDGNALLEGPASGSRSEPPASAGGSSSDPADEPATAILSEPGAVATGLRSGEDQTRPQINTTDQTAILNTGAEAEPRESLSGLSEKQSFSENTAAKPLIASVVVVAVLIGGFLGYRYFREANTKQIESIAVMPFVNEGGNADVEYFSDGMTETLISSLSQLPGLNVKGRSSVFRYKGKDVDTKTLGKELGVLAVLYGRVIQRGDQLTLSLDLLDALTENVIWSGKYDCKQADVVSLQSEIARDVSNKLQTTLSRADIAKVEKGYTANPEAYRLYLQGRFFWNKRTGADLNRSIEYLNKAITTDRNYALAYAGLADCYYVLNYYTGIPVSETAPRAKAYAERAIAIDDQLAEAHVSLAAVYEQLWQWAEAEREHKRAIELNPNYATAYQWYSGLLRDLGLFDEAAVMIKRGHELDPLSSIISMNVSVMYQLQNDHNAGIENAKKKIELDPYFSGAYRYLGLSYLKQGLKREAIANLEKAVELSDRAGVSLADLGYGYATIDDRNQASAIANELEEKYLRKQATGKHVAAVYAGLN